MEFSNHYSSNDDNRSPISMFEEYVCAKIEELILVSHTCVPSVSDRRGYFVHAAWIRK